jgi:hypothetical protein
MHNRTSGPLIIHTRRGAAIALCIGLLITLRNLRYLFELYVPGHVWLIRYRFPPTLFDRVLHLCCAALFTWGLIFILRRTRGAERTYLAVFVFVAILAPLSDISAAARVHLYAWTATLLEFGLIPSAIQMYQTLPAYRLPSQAGSSTTR